MKLLTPLVMFIDNKVYYVCMKIQVPECIKKIALAEIKLLALTQDKMETSVKIGYINQACSTFCF